MKNHVPVPDVTGIDVAFGGKAMQILPKMADIPDEFKNSNRPNKWMKCVSDWFFCGLKSCKWVPKEGVDTKKAIAAVSCCIRSFEPSHEHKEAGCAYLLSQWFDDVTYTKAKGPV